MALIEIRDVLDNETGKTIFPRTHVDAVIGLEDSSFFEKVQDADDPTKFSIKLKSEYTGLWTEGWMAAGGIGTGNSGGGGLVETVSRWSDLQNMSTAPEDGTSAVFNSRAVYEVYQAVKALQQSTPNISLSNGNSYSTLSVNGTSAEFYTKSQVDSLLANIDLSGYVTTQDLTTALSSYVTANDLTTAIGNINHLSSVTTNRDGTMDFNWKNGDVTRADLSHRHLDYENSISTINANYVPKSRTINGHSLSSDVTLSATADLGVATWAMDRVSSGTTIPFDRLPGLYTAGTKVTSAANFGTLLGVTAISRDLSSTGSEPSLIKWEPNAGGSGVGAWHFYGNLYADGWVAAGGIGDDGGSVSYLNDIGDVSLSSPSNGQVLGYSSGNWINTSLKTINGLSIIGSGDITVQGGGSSVSWGTYSSTAHTIELTVNGTSYVLCENGYSAGGGVSSESDPVFTASPAYGITAAKITEWDNKSTFSGNYNDLTNKPTLFSGRWADLTGKPTIPSTLDEIQDGTVRKLSDYVDLTGTQTISGSKTFSAANLVANNLAPLSEQEQGSIGYGSRRWGYVFSVNANLSGNLTLSGTTKRIYFGDTYYIELVNIGTTASPSYALHTNAPLYSDDWIAAGGVQQTS